MPIDETRYLSVAWEMWQGNQFLVPHSNGVAYSHKPPLLFWLIHFSWWLLGVNAWTARLIPPLFGLGSIVLTVRIGRILWPEDRQTSEALPFFLLGMIFWSMYATLTLFDILVTFFSLTASHNLLNAREGQRVRSWLLISLATGLGLLAKGPVVLLYIVPPALLAPWWHRGQGFSWTRWYGSLLLALAGGIMLAVGWALPAARAGGPEYAQAILLGQTTGRVFRSFAHGRPIYWYALWLPLLLFPWLCWGPVWHGLRRLRLDPGSRFCLSVLIPAFVLLSLVSGKQVHYLLPLLPIAALLMARAAASTGAISVNLHPLAWGYIAVGLALLAVPHLPLHGGDRPMLAFLPPWLGTVPLLAGCLLVGSGAGTVPRQIVKVAGSTVLLLVVLHLALMQPLHQLYSQEAIGEALRAAEDGGKMVAVFPARLRDQFHFAGRLTRPLLPINTLEEEVLWAAENPDQYCLFQTDEDGRKYLRGEGIAARFRDGWLVVRPAAGMRADYLHWQSAHPAGRPPATSPPG